MSYLFFDTETNGVPKNYKAPVTDLDNWPRVTQFACAVYDGKGQKLAQICELVKPDGWTIPKEKFFLDNNMSTERCEQDGVSMPGLLSLFVGLIETHNVELLIAHNLAFDSKIIGAEMLRYSVSSSRKVEKFCTMLSTTNVCKIIGPYGYKWPKLEELHRFLFDSDFDGAHDAMNDVEATAKCFFELKKRNLITLP